MDEECERVVVQNLFEFLHESRIADCNFFGCLVAVDFFKEPFEVKRSHKFLHVVEFHRVDEFDVVRHLFMALNLLAQNIVKRKGVGKILLLLFLIKIGEFQKFCRHILKQHHHNGLCRLVVIERLVREDYIRIHDDNSLL